MVKYLKSQNINYIVNWVKQISFTDILKIKKQK